MTHLSVNINKIATLRNSRGGLMPDVIHAAKKCLDFGADGITVHPRPDQRHITRSDAYRLKEVVTKEYNIEGFPSKEFIKMVTEILPDQVTLVPDPPNVLTSNNGWDTIKNYGFLKEIIAELQLHNIRASIFVNPDLKIVEGAKNCNSDRIELYTEAYCNNFIKDKSLAIQPYLKAAVLAQNLELRVNAGHDLNMQNLSFFVKEIENIAEVSIGHALISDSLYLGLENTIQMYKRLL